ncbi:MAG: Rpn family recombination-promoting nuclease/putative transposase, partial [Blastocatellia bacterium]
MKKKKLVPNPHDAFFRRTFARPRMASEFLRIYLPARLAAQLDLTSVTLEDTSFVDQELREHYSDLLLRVSLKKG